MIDVDSGAAIGGGRSNLAEPLRTYCDWTGFLLGGFLGRGWEGEGEFGGGFSNCLASVMDAGDGGIISTGGRVVGRHVPSCVCKLGRGGSRGLITEGMGRGGGRVAKGTNPVPESSENGPSPTGARLASFRRKGITGSEEISGGGDCVHTGCRVFSQTSSRGRDRGDR